MITIFLKNIAKQSLEDAQVWKKSNSLGSEYELKKEEALGSDYELEKALGSEYELNFN